MEEFLGSRTLGWIILLSFVPAVTAAFWVWEKIGPFVLDNTPDWMKRIFAGVFLIFTLALVYSYFTGGGGGSGTLDYGVRPFD